MPYEQDMKRAARQRRFAELLNAQAQQPQISQAGRFAVGPSIGSSVAGLANVLGGAYFDREADRTEETATKSERARLGDTLAKMSATQDGATPDPRRDAAREFVGSLPLDTQRQLVGGQALQKLFPPALKLTEVDAGDRILLKDQFNNTVQEIKKGAAPKGPTEFEQILNSMGLPPEQKQQLLKQYAEKQSTHAPQATTNVTLNTEKSLYGTMADKQAQENVALYSQAQKAPELLQRAQRVKSMLGPTSEAITGAGAEWLLAGAKVANAAGFNTGDAAADTEALARDLAASTLDGIKASGLGAGSGFSNADRDFLERVVGGKISLEGKTLARLAELNEKTALATIDRWNATASRLDPQQLKTLGMSSIEMPQGSPPPGAKPRLQKNPDGSYTFSP